MVSEIEKAEERLKSFSYQLSTECGILERLVYKHKNQHRRCHYFQYILKVRRDLKLLKMAKLDEILGSSFIVITDRRPNQKVQLLESLKRKRSGHDKCNFLERLLGASRLLSQMVEPLVKAAMEISKLFAQSFFMKFCVTTLAVLGRIRVLVQQMLLDVVLVYNTVSALSQREQTIKLNQDGLQVFRDVYPRKETTATELQCIWQADKFVLVEKSVDSDVTNLEIPVANPTIQYRTTEVVLGGDSEDGNAAAESSDRKAAKEKLFDSDPTASAKKEVKRKEEVAFVSVERRPSSSSSSSSAAAAGGGKNDGGGGGSLLGLLKNDQDSFFNLLMGGVKRSRLM